VVRRKCFGRESRGVEFCLCLTKGSQERFRCRIKVICGGELSEMTSQNASLPVYDELWMLRILGRGRSSLSPLLRNEEKCAYQLW
jgi:hypothetical protein